jgi:hypothetical protein
LARPSAGFAVIVPDYGDYGSPSISLYRQSAGNLPTVCPQSVESIANLVLVIPNVGQTPLIVEFFERVQEEELE